MIDNKIAFGGGIGAVVVLAIVFSFFITPIDARDNPLIIEVNKGGTSSGGNVTSVNAGNAITVNQTTGNILVSNNGVWNNIAGSGISVNQTNHNVLITNTAQDNTVCANVGNGKHIYKDGECNFKTLVGSSDISITNTTDTVIIDYNGTVVTSVGATSPIISSGGITPNISCSSCAVQSNTWYLIANATATNTATSLVTSNFTTYKYLKIEIYIRAQTAPSTWGIRFSGDTGNNYDSRWLLNNAAGSTTSGNNWNTQANLGSALFYIEISCRQDVTSVVNQKLCYGVGLENDTPPETLDTWVSWKNSSNFINNVGIVRTAGTGTSTIHTNIMVYGHN